MKSQFRVVELSRVYHTIPQSASKTKRTTDRSRWFFSAGGAGATAGEFLSRHIVASVGALQAEKRRHLGTLQPLLVCFFQLVFVQGNGFHKESVLFGSGRIIYVETFANNAELVEQFHSRRRHSVDLDIHKNSFSQRRESKNRPVATNFQFLKIFCPSGTSLLKLLRVSEVLLLGRACRGNAPPSAVADRAAA